MNRSAGQALFRYLPECIIEWSGGTAITKVSAWIGKPLNPQGVVRILDEVQQKLPMYSSIDRRYPDKFLPKDFEFEKPYSIELELFPLTFYHKRDNKYAEFTSVAQVKKFFNSLSPTEVPNWLQSDLVYVNEKTGSVRSFMIVPCPTHKNNKYTYLDKKNKSSQRDWRWRCIQCRNENNVSGYVDGDFIVKAEPVRSPVVYQPQILSVVNVRDYSNSKVGKENAAPIIITKYLFGLEEDLDDLFDKMGRSRKQGIGSNDYAKKVADLKSKNFSEEQIKLVQEMLASQIRDPSQLEKDMAETQKRLKDIDLKIPSARVYEYIETIKEDTCITLEDLSSSASQSQISLFKQKLDRIGVANSYALEKVPIIQVAYGYTRGKLDPKECVLKAFPNKESQNTIKLYANEINTEAIILEFDREKIGKWLESNKIIGKWDAKDLLDQKAWFLENIDLEMITKFEGVVDSDSEKGRITNSVFTLLHTISHALIKQIPMYAGIAADSMGEIIFPNIPAIMIFSNSQAGFNIGELHELYRNRIYPWVDTVIDSTRISGCVYDPICFEEESACHYCMFLHEVSCGYFNKALRRDHLFSGGKSDLKIGFWDNLAIT